MSLPPVRYVRTSDGINIAFSRLGDGKPIVFASNIFGEVHFYRMGIPHVRQVVDRLAATGWSVVLYDIRGMGASDRDVGDLSLAARLKDLEAVVDRLGDETFVLAGVDLGAATAVAYAAAYPERVAKLALLSPWASGRQMFAVPDLRVVRGMSPEADREWHVFTNSLSDVLTGFENPDLRRVFADTMRKGTSAEGLFAYYDASERIDVTPLLGKIRAPTLVIHDAIFPFGSFDLCRDVAARIRDSEFVVLETRTVAGSEPHQYIRTLCDFLGTDKAAMQGAARPPGTQPRLTKRETEVLQLIASGQNNRAIAETLAVSERTVARHITNIYTKIDVRTKAQATAYALRHGVA